MKKTLFIILTCLLLVNCTLLWEADPENNAVSIFELVWHEFNIRYSLFEEKNVNWDEMYNTYRPQIENSMDDTELFNVLSNMLTELNDKHVSLAADFTFMNSGGWSQTTSPFMMNVITGNYFMEPHRFAGEEMFTYGRITPQIGYIYIKGFAHGMSGLAQVQDWSEEIDIALDYLKDTDALIIDIRNNHGGLPGNVQAIAGRFTDTIREYIHIQTKNGPGPNDFSDKNTYVFSPKGKIQYVKPIVLLTNEITISDGEWFAIAMKTLPNVTQIGTATAGSLSLSLSMDLPNGWIVRISVQKITDNNEYCPEESGIIPAPINTVLNSYVNISNGVDDQLQAAIDFLTP